MTRVLRTVYRYVIAIFFVALVVQVFFAGLGIFGALEDIEAGAIDEGGWDDEIGLHQGFGHILHLVSIVIFLLSLAARIGRNRVLLTLALPLLITLQIFLAALGEDTPVLGALHPVNALVILGLTGYLAYGAWRRWTDLGEPVRA